MLLCPLRLSGSCTIFSSVFPQAPCCLAFPPVRTGLKDLVEVISHSFFQNGALKLHNKLVNERPRDVLDKKVVGVPTRKVDVKYQSQRVRHEDLVLVQLGHVHI